MHVYDFLTTFVLLSPRSFLTAALGLCAENPPVDRLPETENVRISSERLAANLFRVFDFRRARPRSAQAGRP